ncbi:C6 transcription factor [Histoplasma ohiense]|nr:C6 transcription factor [Histoplasma ohiense (nom. inval.)]
MDSHKTSNTTRRVHKNPRVPLSCGPCRARKLKCNRQQPCHNCISRGHDDLCVFANGKTPRSNAMQTQGMECRLHRLEELVASFTAEPGLASQLPNGTKPIDVIKTSLDDDSSQEGSIPELGTMEEKSPYRGSTNWQDVLQEIVALKNTWNQFKFDMEADELDQAFAQGLSTHEPVISAGNPRSLDKAELIASLPPKQTTDQFVNKFFDPNDPAPPLLVIHEPTFRKQYEEHWRNPDRTDVAWLGLLFSMLWMTVQSEIESPKDAAQYMGVGESLAELFRTRTAQCLMHANITRSEPHVIETMCFQALAEYMRRKDIESGIWMALGQIVRAAMRMGFHRDPSHYPKAFSPFQGEMRRRIWAFICQADHVCSFHIGLPSMISSAISDTAMPSNLHDWELTEGMAKLPPSRPMSEVTGITYMVTKSQILQTVGRIGELLYNTKQMSYDRVLQLDQELFQVVRDIPEPFRMTSWNAAETESLFKTMQRVHVGILYSEGMCALHRKYISTARKDQKFALSRQRCLQSAIALIDLQTGLQSLLRPGHHLEQSRWCLAPVANSSFRLAIMIVCLDLQQDGDAQSESIEADDVLIGINRADRMKKVEGAWDTWMNLGDTTAEGQKFHRVFAAVLQKLRSERNGGPDGGFPPPKTPGTLAYTPPQDFSPDMGSGGAGSSIPSSVAYAPGFDDRSSSSAYTEPTPPPVGAPEFYTEVPDLLDTNNWDTLFQEYGFENPNLLYNLDYDPFATHAF